MATLFQIGDDLLALNALCEELPGGELSPEAEAAFDAWAKSIADDEANKLESYCGLVKTLEGEIAVAKAEAEQFAMKARTRENRVKWLKQRMLDYLTGTGRTKAVTTAGRTVAVQANGGNAPLWIDPTIAPEAAPVIYQKIRVEFATDSIRADLEDGIGPNWARLDPRGNHLRIK